MQRFITCEVKVKKINDKYFIEKFEYNLFNNLIKYASGLFDEEHFVCLQQSGIDLVYQFLHNENGPAVIYYYSNGNKKREEYYLNGKLHNNNGPAIIEYFENGKIHYKDYYIDNISHRIDGPAFISYYINGGINSKIYFLNGEELNIKTTKEYKKYIKLQNIS